MSNFNCPHYKTAAKILAPCCNKAYVCRFCHNEQQNHIVDTSEVRFIICLRCNYKQPARENCSNCDIQFGEYFCLKCKLYDENKNQYHCNGCGICRVGPETDFFHCPKCNLCLNKRLLRNHKCVEDVSRDDCPVCGENLHTSRDPLSVLKCGHILHKKCFQQLVTFNSINLCPLCRTNMIECPW